MLLESTFTQFITLKEKEKRIEKVKIHELVEALERASLKCLYTKCQHLARGQKGSEHLNLRGEHS